MLQQSSPGKTAESIDIKQIEDEYKMNDLYGTQENIVK